MKNKTVEELIKRENRRFREWVMDFLAKEMSKYYIETKKIDGKS